MQTRAIVAGLLAGIGMFVWSSIAHIATPLGMAGIQEIPNEAGVLGALRGIGNQSGMYLYPGMAGGTMDQYAAKLASNPQGLLIYHPPNPNAKPMNAGQLVTEFLTEIMEALLAVYLLTRSGVRGFGAGVVFVTIIGVIASMATNVPYWNWYGFPTSYTAAYMTMQIISFIVAGCIAAAMLRERADRAIATRA